MAELNHSIQSEFVKAIKSLSDSNEKKSNLFYGTCSILGENIEVLLDGSNIAIPVESSVEVCDGDRVSVSIQDHRAVIVSDFSTPAANTKTTSLIREDINRLEIEIENPADELYNTSVTIDETGIEMRGGEMTFEAGTKFQIKSGGAVLIDASNDSAEESHINLGDGNFSVSKTGGMTASSGSFETGLTVGGQQVLTEADIPYKIVFSNDQPTGHNLFWFKPVDPGVTRINYQGQTPASRNDQIRFGATNPIPITLSSISSDIFTLLGNYKYDISFEIYSLAEVALNGLSFEISLTKGSSVISMTTAEPSYTLPRKYSSAIVQASVTTTTNLCSDTNPIYLNVKAINTTTDPHHPDWLAFGGLYIQSNQTISLMVSDLNSSGTVQPCAVYFMP